MTRLVSLYTIFTYGILYLMTIHHEILPIESFTLVFYTSSSSSILSMMSQYKNKKKLQHRGEGLYGSIYAPNGKDNEDENNNNNNTADGSGGRDHLGLKRSSNGGVKPISSWATTSSSNSSSDNNEESTSTMNDIQQAVEDAVIKASKLQQQEETNPIIPSSSISVRFINFDTMGGLEKVTVATPGANILKIADVRVYIYIYWKEWFIHIYI